MYWHWRDYTWSRQCPRGRPRRGTRRRWKKASSGPPSQARLGPRIPDPGRGHAAWVKRVRCMPHKPWNRPQSFASTLRLAPTSPSSCSRRALVAAGVLRGSLSSSMARTEFHPNLQLSRGAVPRLQCFRNPKLQASMVSKPQRFRILGWKGF